MWSWIKKAAVIGGCIALGAVTGGVAALAYGAAFGAAAIGSTVATVAITSTTSVVVGTVGAGMIGAGAVLGGVYGSRSRRTDPNEEYENRRRIDEDRQRSQRLREKEEAAAREREYQRYKQQEEQRQREYKQKLERERIELERKRKEAEAREIEEKRKAEEIKSKNNSAEKTNNDGLMLFNQGLYRESLNKFKESVNTCVNDYKNKQLFQENYNKANVEVHATQLYQEGNDLFKVKRYDEALIKYQEAYNTSCVNRERTKYNAEITKAQLELEAALLGNEAQNLFDARKYREALIKGVEARNKSQYNKNYYDAVINSSFLEVEAIKLGQEAQNLFNARQYNIALIKAKLAQDKSQKNKSSYLKIITDSDIEITALKLSESAKNFFNHGNYKEAYNKSIEAQQRSQHNKYNYIGIINQSKAEICATQLCQEGNDLFKVKRYDEALIKYKEAYNTSCVNRERTKYQAEITKTQIELEAIILGNEAQNFFNIGEYQKALVKGIAARNKSQYNKSKHDSVINDSQVEVDAQNLGIEGQHYLDNYQFEDARNKFQHALNKSKVSSVLNNLQEKFWIASNRQAELLNCYGENLFDSGDYARAKTKFQAALDLSNIQENKDIYYINITKAQAEIEAQNLSNEASELKGAKQFYLAHKKLLEASIKSKVLTAKKTYHANAEELKIEANAQNISNIADEFFQTGSYTKAILEYQRAAKNSKDIIQVSIYHANAAKAQIELDAQKANYEGERLIKEKKYAEALKWFQLAMMKSQVEDQKQIYINNVQIMQKKISYKQIKAEARELYNKGCESEDNDDIDRFEEEMKFFNDSLAKSQQIGDSKNATKTRLKIESKKQLNYACELEEQAQKLWRDNKIAEAKPAFEVCLRQAYCIKAMLDNLSEFDDKAINSKNIVEEFICDTKDTLSCILTQAINQQIRDTISCDDVTHVSNGASIQGNSTTNYDYSFTHYSIN